MAAADLLLAKLQAASGPDRDLDHDLYEVLFEPPGKAVLPGGAVSRSTFVRWPPGGNIACACPAFTASIDTALELIERVLPTWRVSLSLVPKPKSRPAAYLELWLDDDDEDPVFKAQAFGATPALALLCAALRAICQLTPVRA